MAFGKKPAAPKAHAPVRQETAVEHEIVLDSAQLEDVRTARAYLEAVDLERHYLMDYLGQVNATLPDGVNVAPFMMVPEACWSGPWGEFLLKYLELTPFGSWNVVFLPRDERSAEALEIRPHPGEASERSLLSINGGIEKLLGQVKAAHDELESRGADESEMDALHDHACQQMYALALMIGRKVIGEKWLDHALWRFSTKEGMAQVA